MPIPIFPFEFPGKPVQEGAPEPPTWAACTLVVVTKGEPLNDEIVPLAKVLYWICVDVLLPAVTQGAIDVPVWLFKTADAPVKPWTYIGMPVAKIPVFPETVSVTSVPERLAPVIVYVFPLAVEQGALPRMDDAMI